MTFLLTILIIFLVFSLIFRYIPYLLTWWLRRKVNKMNNQGQTRSRHDTNEGEVYISKDKKENKIIEKNVGEYVDYEPVNDDK